MTSEEDVGSDKLVTRELLSLGDTGGVLLTMNRPEARNPIDIGMLGALHAELDAVAQAGDAAAIVITGAGDLAFSAGGDLKGYQSLFKDRAAFERFMAEFDAVCDMLETSPALTVAAVNGACVAGGLELALACDIITMADTAVIGDGHLRFGQVPGAGSSQRLVRAIGVQRARRWLLTGDLFGPQEAVDAGLVSAVFPQRNLIEGTVKLVSSAATHSPLARSVMKRMIRVAMDEALSQGLEQERDLAATYASESFDAHEGLAAFAERREPRYEGR